MRRFTHKLILKIINFKISDFIEVGSAPSETRW